MNKDQSDITSKLLNHMHLQKRRKYLNDLTSLIAQAQQDSIEKIGSTVLKIIKRVGYASFAKEFKDDDIKLIEPLIQNDIDLYSGFFQEYQLSIAMKYFKSLYYKLFILDRFNLLCTYRTKWYSNWDEYVDCGKNIIIQFYDIVAIKAGYEHIRTITPELAKKFDIWKEIIECETFLLRKLTGNQKKFYPLSEQIFSIFTQYPNFPESTFKDFLKDILTLRKNCVRINHYQKDFSALEANNILNQIQMNFQDYPTASQAYLYDIALVENTIKWHILRQSTAISNNGNIVTTGYGDLIKNSNVYVFQIAHDLYSLHMSTPDQHTWLVPQKKMMSFFSKNDHVKGALFCSRRRVHDNCLRVQFQNFVNTASMKKLLMKKEEASNSIVLTHKDIAKKDLRHTFLKKASMHAIGVNHAQKDLKYHAKQNLYSLQRQIKQAQQIFSDYFTIKNIAVPALAIASILFIVYFSLPTSLSTLVNQSFQSAVINEMTFIDQKPFPWEVNIQKYGFSSSEDFNENQKAFGAGLWMARRLVKKDKDISKLPAFFKEKTMSALLESEEWSMIQNNPYYLLGQWMYLIRNVCLSGKEISSKFWHEQIQVMELLRQEIKQIGNDYHVIDENLDKVDQMIHTENNQNFCVEIVPLLDHVIQTLSPE